MSENPYQPPEYSNPYQAPTPPTYQPQQSSPADQLRVPAIVLLAFETPWAAYMLLSFLIQIPRLIFNFQQNGATPERVGEAIGMMLPQIFSIGIIWGAIEMLRMNSYRSARMGAIMALAPLCGPCIIAGIPLGIWALIVLARPEVKAGFAKP